MAKKTEKDSIDSLVFDDKNVNKHTKHGMQLLKKSIKNNGLGRSILVDKNNRIIAGNGVAEVGKLLGKNKIKIIETQGEELIVVKRTDIDLDSDTGRNLAVADNAVSSVNFNPDEKVIEELINDYNLDEEILEVIYNSGSQKNSGIKGEESIEIEQSVQLKPPMEYILIMCEPNSVEWEELKQKLKLKKVSRGGYKEGSSFNSIGLERVFYYQDFIKRYDNSDTK